jgi:hypothetical protein
MGVVVAAPSSTQASIASDKTVPLPSVPKQPSSPAKRKEGGPPYILWINPFDEGEQTAQAMENWFQACADDEPFSLELVGTRNEQGFVLRASSAEQLARLRKQFEAQFPQAEIIAPDQDPLAIQPGELVLVGEFGLAKEAWMPLKMFTGDQLESPGGDPLAHILASMESVSSSPPGSGRTIVSQLVLQRAPDSWIASDIRKAVEHPLQEERDEKSAELKGVKAGPAGADSAEGVKLILLFVAVAAIFFGYRWYQEHAYLQFGLLVFSLIASGIGFLWWRMRKAAPPIYDMKLVADKLMRQAFYCQLRVIVKSRVPASTTAEKVEMQLCEHLSHLEVAYRQFSLASANSLYLKRSYLLRAGERKAQTLTDLSQAFPYRHWMARLLHGGPTKCVLNGLELSGMYHLPQACTDLPLVRRTSVKHLLFSPEVARRVKEKKNTPQPPVSIGHSKHRGHTVDVALPFSTLYANKFLVGRSRSGKSVLIQLLASGAMRLVGNGQLQPGFFAIDPHRDLAEDLLRLVPSSRMKDVLLFDFTDTQHPVALNPLDASMGFTRDQAVANLMSAFARIWHETWGPRMSYFLESVCLLLYTLNEDLVAKGKADQQYTLLDINPLLQYQDYAIKVLSKLNMKETWHQELMAWWAETYFQLPTNSSFRNEVITPILSKIGIFNNNSILRRIVGQPVTRAPIHLAVTEGKLVICSLSSRDMDDMAVNILGSTMLNLLHAAFRHQQETPLTERRRVFVAVDEFQNFSGSTFDKLLSEDAKFGCSMLMATQNLARLARQKQYEGLLEVVLSNCQNFFAFNMSAADAKLMEEEYQMKVLQKDFITQPPLHCYVRLAIEHEPIQIASVFLARPASWGDSSKGQAIVRTIRDLNHNGRADAQKIDDDYKKHLQRFLDVYEFTGWVARRVEEQEKRKRYRESTQEDKKQEPHDQEAALPSQSRVSEQKQVPDKEQKAARSGENGDSEKQGGHRNGSTSPTDGQHSTDSTTKTGNGRNNKRSRRLKRLRKSKVGMPPPGLQGDSWNDSNDPLRPIPFPSSRGRGSGYEGRERGERA